MQKSEHSGKLFVPYLGSSLALTAVGKIRRFQINHLYSLVLGMISIALLTVSCFKCVGIISFVYIHNLRIINYTVYNLLSQERSVSNAPIWNKIIASSPLKKYKSVYFHFTHISQE